jgi:hypothetical protein
MPSLLNKKATRDYILKKCDKTRLGWDCKRVSKSALDEIEAFMRVKLDEAIHRHPTVGKTFTSFR